jgi:hypothetical protein
MGRLFVLTAAVLCFTALQAAYAQTPTPCTDEKVLEVVQADPEVIAFCAAEVKGAQNGCVYKVRPAVAGDTPGIKWTVWVSLIYSFTDTGEPILMGTGDLTAGVSQDCKITNTLGSTGCKARKGHPVCPKL